MLKLPLVYSFLFLLQILRVSAQSNLNLKYFGVMHPQVDLNVPLKLLNPDKKGYLVFNFGGS